MKDFLIFCLATAQLLMMLTPDRHCQQQSDLERHPSFMTELRRKNCLTPSINSWSRTLKIVFIVKCGTDKVFAFWMGRTVVGIRCKDGIVLARDSTSHTNLRTYILVFHKPKTQVLENQDYENLFSSYRKSPFCTICSFP